MNPSDGYVIVTGATGAIGTEIATALCSRGTNLVLACRNTQKGNRLAQQLRAMHTGSDIHLLMLDLSSEQSIHDALEQLAHMPICGLINNAGVMNRNFTTAPDGNELTMTVNYHNTALFTRGVVELMKPEGGKIVFTTSLTRHLHRSGKRPAAISADNYSQLGVYGLSKRLITDFAKELSATLPACFCVNCADPGIVDSEMITMHRWFDTLADYAFRPFIRTPREGAIPALRAFDADTTGGIYCRRAIHKL